MHSSSKMNKNLNGLFINTKREICSIYESGIMVYEILKKSPRYNLDYIEVDSRNNLISTSYDFYIFNYHWIKMGWLDTEGLRGLSGFKATIVLEVSQNSPFDCVSKNDFDAYLVLDPTCSVIENNAYAFPRPLEGCLVADAADELVTQEVVVGSFGLSSGDKGFDEVVRAVNKEFSYATIRINIPISANNTEEDFNEFKRYMHSIERKPNIKLELTSQIFKKDDLIRWCQQNTLNIFLYNRRVGNGLAATTDQAISSGRPLLVSTNPTFRHIHQYIKPYPYTTLQDAIHDTPKIIEKIKDEWSESNFIERFHQVIDEGIVKKPDYYSNKLFKLPLKRRWKLLLKKVISYKFLLLFMPPIGVRGYQKMRGKKIKSLEQKSDYYHQALGFFCQTHEDLLVDYLFRNKKSGSYIEVAPQHPTVENSTYHFYIKSWCGILIGLGDDVEVENELIRKNDSKLFIRDFKDQVQTINLMNCIKSILVEKFNDCSHIDVASFSSEKYIDFFLSEDFINQIRPTIYIIKHDDTEVRMQKLVARLDKAGYLLIVMNKSKAVFLDKFCKDTSVLDALHWIK